MNLNELNYILCIAKHRNLTKAASELFISQPTLSKYLQKTERELDIKLFHRTDNHYLPTHAGRQYLNYAAKMLDIHKEWEKELCDLKSMRTGELNIAFPLMRSSCMVPAILPLFHKMHPQICVNFLEETYAVQETLLLNDQVDFAIFNETVPHPKLTYEPLGSEEILLVVSADHPLAQSGISVEGNPYQQISLVSFAADSFILHFPEQTTGRIARTLFEQCQMAPQILFQTRNTQAAIELAAKGLGVCFAPESYIRFMKFEYPPVCFSIAEAALKSPLSIAYRKGAYLPDYAKNFISITSSYMKEALNGTHTI